MVTGPEIRAAKKFLRSKGFQTGQISPRKFALAAKDLDCGFKETLTYLGGQDGTERRGSEGQRDPVQDAMASGRQERET